MNITTLQNETENKEVSSHTKKKKKRKKKKKKQQKKKKKKKELWRREEKFELTKLMFCSCWKEKESEVTKDNEKSKDQWIKRKIASFNL